MYISVSLRTLVVKLLARTMVLVNPVSQVNDIVVYALLGSLGTIVNMVSKKYIYF